MNKYLIVIGIAVLLVAVGLSGCNEIDSSNKESSDDNFWEDEEDNIEIIEIEAMGVVQTVNYLEKPVKLIVDGMNCVITVTKESNLNEVIINGMNSIVEVSRSHSFTSTINGMNAEIVFYD